MIKYLNDHVGIVMSVKKDHMVIDLRRGGEIKAPLTEGIKSGDLVAFLMDPLEQKVTHVILKTHADKAVACGSNHLIDVAHRDIHQEIEEERDGNTNRTEWIDESIFWCPDLG